MNPKTGAEVTVLMLAWNRPQYLEEALHSVSSQSYLNWRFILSDNSSNAEAAHQHKKLFEEFRKMHPDSDIRYVFREGKMLAGQHLAIALQDIETEFVALHSDDDVWLPHHLQQAIEWLCSGQTNGMTTSNALIIDSQSNETEALLNDKLVPQPQTSAAWLRIWLSSFFGNQAGFVLRSSAVRRLPNFDFDIQDVGLAIWVLLQGYKCWGFPEPSYRYRVHSNSVTALGDSFIMERHRLRQWFAKHYFWKLTSICPAFPILVLKSLYILKRTNYKPRRRGIVF